MSIESLITCACGHCVDDHDTGGCTGAANGAGREGPGRHAACTCRHSRRSVLDALLDIERKTIHQEWQITGC